MCATAGCYTGFMDIASAERDTDLPQKYYEQLRKAWIELEDLRNERMHWRIQQEVNNFDLLRELDYRQQIINKQAEQIDNFLIKKTGDKVV